MEIKKHYFMTVAALFFLGIIVAKPGSTFNPSHEQRECKLVKGKMDCSNKYQDNYKINHASFWYQSE